MTYIDQLIKNCNIAKSARPTWELVVNDLNNIESVRTAIYEIEQIGGNPEKTFSDYSSYKKGNERSCAKLNNPSMVMYVGSSTTGVKKRLEQHLGLGAKGTYALHLSHWFKGKYQITIKEYDVPREVLQIIEDDLSHKLHPAFGKSGGNNR